MSASRRAFLQAMLGCALSGPAYLASRAEPRAQFPTDPRARIAVATYPFRAFINAPGNHDREPSKPGMDLPAFALFIHERFQVGGIEPLHSHFPSTSLDDVRRLRAAFDHAGVRTINIPVDEQVDLCSKDPSVRQAGFDAYRRWIDIAVLLDSPSIRIGLPQCSANAPMHQVVEALQPTMSYAASRNIVINFENDDPVYDSASRIAAALDQAHNSYLKALPDFANSLMGGDEHFNAQAVGLMFARAWNIAHVKDAEIIRNRRETVSLAELFGIAKRSGYRGFYSMESDSGVDPIGDTQHLIEQTVALC